MSHICHYYFNILCLIYKNINKKNTVESSENDDQRYMFDLFSDPSIESKNKREAQMRNINFCIDYLLETQSADFEEKVN